MNLVISIAGPVCAACFPEPDIGLISTIGINTEINWFWRHIPFEDKSILPVIPDDVELASLVPDPAFMGPRLIRVRKADLKKDFFVGIN
jgi:hypothetical protein